MINDAQAPVCSRAPFVKPPLQTNMKLQRVVEIVTVGLPFCAFKVLCGTATNVHSPLGWTLVAWGLIDTVLNTINLFALGRPVFGICATHLVATRASPRYADVGVAIDVFLSFVLVALMIAANGLGELSPFERGIWNVSVILNVLGAGIGRLTASLRSMPTASPARTTG